VKIALDAMGSDGAPDVEVKGAILAARRLPVSDGIILVGDRKAVSSCLRDLPELPDNIEVFHASEAISMVEAPVAGLKKKKDSSISRALGLVRDGAAEAVVGAGNTGATVGAARLALGSLPGVERPAIAATLPSRRGFFTLIDSGANTDCRPQHLLQFAQMGVEYHRFNTGEPNPRVGLLNIGMEEKKGNDLVREAYRLLAVSGLDFAGNLEGSEIFMGAADVIVADGFVGNVFLKAAEGASATLQHMLFREMRRCWWSTAARLLLRPVLFKMWQRTDFEEYGGAPLLGVDGICIIAHGRSTPKAIASALELAGRFASRNVNRRLVSAVAAGQA